MSLHVRQLIGSTNKDLLLPLIVHGNKWKPWIWFLQSDRDTVFGQYEKEGYATYMAVNKSYKYIYSAPDNKEMLFDLQSDPGETRNKAYSPLYIEKTKKMREPLIDYFKGEGYTTPIENDTWKQYAMKDMPEDPDAYLLFQDPVNTIPHIPGYETESNRKQNFRFAWFDELYDTV